MTGRGCWGTGRNGLRRGREGQGLVLSGLRYPGEELYTGLSMGSGGTEKKGSKYFAGLCERSYRVRESEEVMLGQEGSGVYPDRKD